MNPFIHVFRNKRSRLGAYSTLSTIVVITGLVAVNFISSSLHVSYDVSRNQSYSISKYSAQIVRKVQDPITIYVLAKPGSENPEFKNLISDYPTYNSKIKVEVKDPNLYPQLVDKFKSDPSQPIASNSVVVENGRTNKFKLIDAEQLITVGFDQQTYKQYVQSIDVEPQITNAIEQVTNDRTPTIYSITGNGELSLPEKLINAIKLANYDLKDINVLTENVPKDTSLLFVTTPARDWTPDISAKVKSYLQNGGKAVVALNYTTSGFPNLLSVLGAYGVFLENKVVIEPNTNNALSNQPTLLLPNLETNEITSNLADKQYKVLVPVATGLQQNQMKRSSVRVTPLLTSSAKSYAKNSSAQSADKANGDLSGPFHLAVTITDRTDAKAESETRLVVIGADSLISPESNSVSGGTNYNFIVNSINWTQGKEIGSYIPPKPPHAAAQLQVSGTQASIITLVTVVVIPLAILAVGFVVWVRRRNS